MELYIHLLMCLYGLRSANLTCVNILGHCLHCFASINKQDIQLTYNVTLGRVRELLLPWKSNKNYIFLFVCACSRACACARAHVALLIQHAIRMCRIVLCGLSGSTTFIDVINDTIFGKKNVIEHKMCFDFLYNVCLKHFSF